MMSYKNLTTGFKWTLPTIYYAFPRGKSGDTILNSGKSGDTILNSSI